MKKFNKYLDELCKVKNNRLCLGLDIDNSTLKTSSLDYMNDFILDIIDNTLDICPVYKINFAFYERFGHKGFKILENISKKLEGKAISIADAKRGDIGNSSKFYAESIFDYLNFDSVTISPYMGKDSILPFVNYKNKGTFILCLTSNPGSIDIQKKLSNKKSIYQHVINMANDLNENENIGLVVGATNDEYMLKIKKLSKKLPWLMPGVGFQGGNLKKSILIGEKNGLSIINVSRGILRAGNGSINDIRKAAEYFTDKIREII